MIGSNAFLDVRVTAHEAATLRDLRDSAENVSKRSTITRDGVQVLGVRLDAVTARAGLLNVVNLRLLYVSFVSLLTTRTSSTTATAISLHTVQCIASMVHSFGKLTPWGTTSDQFVTTRYMGGRSSQLGAAWSPTARSPTSSCSSASSTLLAAYATDGIAPSPLINVRYNDPVIGGNAKQVCRPD